MHTHIEYSIMKLWLSTAGGNVPVFIYNSVVFILRKFFKRGLKI